MDPKIRERLLDYLLGFTSENKKNLFEKNILYRTRHITVVLEDIFQPHNASAVLRTCDCFGIQDVHIIENNYKYEVNPDVALGASKWLTLHKYNSTNNNTQEAFTNLRNKGYRIIATTPHKNEQLIDDLKLDSKIALVFGTELNGLSDLAIKNADEFVKIPMFGFTESFNISVSAAIFLHVLTEKLRKTNGNWQLTDEEKTDIKLEWVKNAIKRSELLVQKFLKNY